MSAASATNIKYDHALPYYTIPHHPILPLYSILYQLFLLSLLHCGFNALFCFVHSICMTRLLHKITTQSVSSFHALICLEGISYLFCIVCGVVLLVWEHSKPGAVIRSREGHVTAEKNKSDGRRQKSLSAFQWFTNPFTWHFLVLLE